MSDHSTPTGYDASSPGGINSRLIVILFAIAAVLLIVILASVEAWFYNQERQVAEESYQRGNPQLQELLDGQEQRLSALNRIEGDEKHVTVPLDRAIEEIVAEHKASAK